MGDLDASNGVDVEGNVAHDAVDTGSPVKVGGRYQSAPGSVSGSNDRVDAWFDGRGRLGTFIGGFDVSAATVATVQVPADAQSGTGLNVNAQLEGLNASAGWDRIRTIAALSVAPNVTTGILAVGVGPGYDRKLDPANLAAAANSAITEVVNGADVAFFAIGTTTTGTFIFEVTSDDTNWVTADIVNAQTGAIQTAAITPTSGVVWRVAVGGWRQVRVRVVTLLGATVAVKYTLHLGRYMPATWRELTNTRAADVSIVDGNGNQITSFGGGTQYAEDVALGAVGAATGTLMVGRATAYGTTPTTVSADNDAVGAWMGRSGEQMVGQGPGFHRSITTVNATGATDATIYCGGAATVIVDISGTFTGLSGSVQGSVDNGATYTDVHTFMSYELLNSRGEVAQTAIGTARRYYVNTAGFTHIRYHVTAVSTGTAVIAVIAQATPYALVPSNQQFTAMSSAARTATTAASDVSNYHNRGAYIFVNVTSITSTPVIAVQIQGKEPIGSNYYTICEFAAITATGTYAFLTYPGQTRNPGVAESFPLPRTWRVNVVHQNANSITYSVSAMGLL